MIKELTQSQVIFNFQKADITGGIDAERQDYIPNMETIYDDIDKSISIKKEGYNLYIIDNFSKEKLNEIIKFISKKLKEKSKPKDILYVTYKEDRKPACIKLSNGMGQVFKQGVEDLKKEYKKKIFDFYNSPLNPERDLIIDELQEKRDKYINTLDEMAESEGFSLKTTISGFAFIPVKENEDVMSEEEYDDLKSGEKKEITSKALKLKVQAKQVIEDLKELEIQEKDKLKEVFINMLQEELKDMKIKVRSKLQGESLFYIDEMCDYIESSIAENYSVNYESDVEKIEYILSRYNVNLLVNNADNKNPVVIYEENPTVQNLIGDIEYKAEKGSYSTDVSLINAGDILKADGGVLIINANSLADIPGAYQQIRRFILSGKVSFDYNRNYIEFFTLSMLRPEPIKVDVKVILIGDYKMYNLFNRYDEEFKSMFKITSEYNPIVNFQCGKEGNSKVISYILNIISDNNLLPIEEDAVIEILRLLSRKAESNKKILLDDKEIEKILFISNNIASKQGAKFISKDNVLDIFNKKSILREELLELYIDKKININVNSVLIGSINGLSVIDTGRETFGKPVRITCICTKGSGRLIDFQKENNLSGPIHEKSINILRSVFDSLIDKYSKLPVDFNLSFEQTYGKLEGDSASAAEIICMISAICKVGIKQNIAITGSVNQFGEIQPIGGVNEKIEGFYNVCKAIDSIDNKGVIIPSSNIDDIVLCSEVEQAIKDGKFKIYSMDNIYDAMQLLMCTDKVSVDDILKKVNLEIKKFQDK